MESATRGGDLNSTLSLFNGVKGVEDEEVVDSITQLGVTVSFPD